MFVSPYSPMSFKGETKSYKRSASESDIENFKKIKINNQNNNVDKFILNSASENEENQISVELTEPKDIIFYMKLNEINQKQDLLLGLAAGFTKNFIEGNEENQKQNSKPVPEGMYE